MGFGVAIVVVVFERRGLWARVSRSVLFIFLSLVCCLGFAGLVVAFVIAGAKVEMPLTTA